MYRSLIAGLVILAAAEAATAMSSTTATVASVCPPDTPTAHRRLNLLLVGHADFRAEHGIPAIDTSAVRPLVDPTDVQACTILSSTIHAEDGVVSTYYTGGGYYFVVSGSPTRVALPNGMIRHLEWAPAVVLDSAFNVLGVEGI